MKRFHVSASSWIASLILVVAPLAEATAPQKGPDLTEATLEDLMNVEVTSVSKKEQRLLPAPAAIYFITQEDIRRSGMDVRPDGELTASGQTLQGGRRIEYLSVGPHSKATIGRGFIVKLSGVDRSCPES